MYGAGWEVFPPSAISVGKFAVNHDTLVSPQVDVCEDSVEMYKDGVFDWIFVGRRLENFDNPQVQLKLIIRKLRVGGHLILHLPINSTEPFISTRFDTVSAHKMVEGIGSWVCKGEWAHEGWSLGIYKKHLGPKGITERKRSTKPTACIARYGALGDAIIMTPLIRQLAEDGYEVTLNITPYAAAVLEHNPYISNVIIQERDVIPNPQLGEYWELWRGEYDRYINLSESLEGSLLIVEKRREFYSPKSYRHGKCNVNYFDQTMRLGGYPEITGRRGELYFTSRELKEAQQFRDRYANKFLIMWALNGSSHHKVYPFMEPFLREWLPAHPDAVVVTVGDKTAQLLEIDDHPQVVCKADRWTIRQAMCMTQFVDLVIGPETGILNAAGCYDTPKVTFLSHSTHENLCKYWLNDHCIEPDAEVAPCYPCHQLHYSRESCPLLQVMDEETKEVITTCPACTIGVIPSRLAEHIEPIYASYR